MQSAGRSQRGRFGGVREAARELKETALERTIEGRERIASSTALMALAGALLGAPLFALLARRSAFRKPFGAVGPTVGAYKARRAAERLARERPEVAPGFPGRGAAWVIAIGAVAIGVAAAVSLRGTAVFGARNSRTPPGDAWGGLH